MKKSTILRTTAVALALGALAPAFAQTTYYDPALQPSTPYPTERIYVPGERVNGALHGGFVAPGDEVLLDRTLAALASKRELNGTATVVAKNGEIIMNGSTDNYEDSQRMIIAAKQAAGGRVTAWFSEM